MGGIYGAFKYVSAIVKRALASSHEIGAAWTGVPNTFWAETEGELNSRWSRAPGSMLQDPGYTIS